MFSILKSLNERCRDLLDTSDPPEKSGVLGARNCNPEDIGFLELVLEDFETYECDPSQPGLWAVLMHRFGNLRMDIRPKLLRAPVTILYRLGSTTINWFWGIDLGYTVRLGRRVRLWHHGGMVLGARSIGDDVHIRHNTTFGVLNRQELNGKPTIEDRVEVGAGVCVLGEVTVGHDTVIGANSAVLRDVRPHSTMLGVPARPVGMSASKALEKRSNGNGSRSLKTIATLRELAGTKGAKKGQATWNEN